MRKDVRANLDEIRDMIRDIDRIALEEIERLKHQIVVDKQPIPLLLPLAQIRAICTRLIGREGCN